MKKLTSLTLAALMAFSAAGVTAMADSADPSTLYYSTIFTEDFENLPSAYIESYSTANDFQYVQGADNNYGVVTLKNGSGNARFRTKANIELKAGKYYKLSYRVKGISDNTNNTKLMWGINSGIGGSYGIANNDAYKMNTADWTTHTIYFTVPSDAKEYIFGSSQGLQTPSYAIDDITLAVEADAPASVDPTATIVEGTKAVYNGTGVYAEQTAVGFVAELIANDGSINALGVKVGNDDRGTQPITVLTNTTAHVGVVVADADANSAIDLYIK